MVRYGMVRLCKARLSNVRVWGSMGKVGYGGVRYGTVRFGKARLPNVGVWESIVWYGEVR